MQLLQFLGGVFFFMHREFSSASPSSIPQINLFTLPLQMEWGGRN